MDVFTVSFFGHRQLIDALTIEQHLETHIHQLLLEKEYVEFLVGRDGEFDLLVASVIRRCKREVSSDNSSLVWVLPYKTAEYRNHEDSFRAYNDEIQICEEAAHGHYKNTYKCRNQIMVNRSDLVIFCSANPVKSDYNGLERRRKEKTFRQVVPFVKRIGNTVMAQSLLAWP